MNTENNPTRATDLDNSLAKKAFEDLMNLPQDQREQVVSHFMSVTEAYSGPLPHPDLLARYNQIIPNGAERIMAMAESEQKCRHDIDKKVTDADVSLAKRGQIIGATLALLIAGAGLWMTLEGHEVVGGTVFGTTVVGLVSVFVAFGRKNK